MVIQQTEAERHLQSTPSASTITQPPQPQNPDLTQPDGQTDTSGNPQQRIQVSATYSYLVYTDSNSDQAQDEVQKFLQTKLEEGILDLVEDVQLIDFTVDPVSGEPCQGPPTGSDTPAWVPPTFATCAKYQTTLVAEMGREWEEDVFQRTVVRTMETYIDSWNESQQQSAFVLFFGPIEVRAEITLLIVGARRLMPLDEAAFMANVVQTGPFEKAAKENDDPPFTIVDIEHMWQQIVARDGTSGDGGDSRRRRYLQDTTNQDEELPPKSNQVRLLVMATCGGGSCTDENLETFVTTTLEESSDEIFQNLKDWSSTNYFRNDFITGLMVDNEGKDAELIEEPELPPESNYETPGVQENDPPLWIWLSMLIAAGAVFVACVYVTFCLTARDFQAARDLRKDHRETKQKTAAASAGAAAAAREQPEVPLGADSNSDENDDSPRSPAAGESNIEEVAPSTPSPSKKKKKKKKKRSSSPNKKAKKENDAADEDA